MFVKAFQDRLPNEVLFGTLLALYLALYKSTCLDTGKGKNTPSPLLNPDRLGKKAFPVHVQAFKRCIKMSRCVLSIWLLLFLCWPAFAETITGKVVGVHDGDTITVLDASRIESKVRLNGIDAPELGQAFGQASKRNLSGLVFGKTVGVETGKTDRYGRLVGTVLLDGKDANLAQLKAGLAWYYKQYERDVAAARRESYAAAEREARQARRGLWADPAPVAPWGYRHPDNETGTFADPNKKDTGAPGNSTAPAAQPGGLIRGNKNSMIYHAPHCPDYDRVSERNRVSFKSEAEAQAAGYRKARNCP